MSSNSTTIYLVSCVAKKREQACPARELYASPWFLKARNYVEQSRYRWFILSAMYGLVAPDRVIAPYEQTLNDMSVEQRKAWAKETFDQISEAVSGMTFVIFLAGKRYREFLARHLADSGVAVSVPMKGLRIGEQLRWLGQHSPPY
jgi:cytoplasmic iron level regulating protein YaaA (DUF328/UPF0246 family)